MAQGGKEKFLLSDNYLCERSSPQHPLPASPCLFTGRRDPVLYILRAERFHHGPQARPRRLVSGPSDKSGQVWGVVLGGRSVGVMHQLNESAPSFVNSFVPHIVIWVMPYVWGF